MAALCISSPGFPVLQDDVRDVAPAEVNAALFSLDRWRITAFGRKDIAAVGHEEHTGRVLASRESIWDSAAEILR
jgi:hypothetical protein